MPEVHVTELKPIIASLDFLPIKEEHSECNEISIIQIKYIRLTAVNKSVQNNFK